MTSRSLMPAAVIFLALASTTISAQPQHPEDASPFKLGQSIYVVAVKARLPQERDVWLKLNPTIARNGKSRPVSPPGVTPTGPSASDAAPSGRTTLEREIPSRPTLERVQATRRVLPPLDADLKQQIEAQLLQQKVCKLANTVENADLVLFAQGVYLYYEKVTSPGRPGSGMTILRSVGDDDETSMNTLARINLAAVAAADYRAWQSDVEQLLTQAKWRGEVWGEMRPGRDARFILPAVPDLIRQFQQWALGK